jgi:hypothetical protein
MDALLIELYNKTRESVVLIRSTVSDGVGQGSGFIFDVSGHIVTNFHVVEDALRVTVTFIDGTIFDAEIIGTDPTRMSPSLGSMLRSLFSNLCPSVTRLSSRLGKVWSP